MLGDAVRTYIKWLISLAFVVLVVLRIGFIIEGASSFIFILGKREEALGERAYTNYDSLLGWVNTPSLEMKDLFGEGADYHTNDQGFRNKEHFQKEVPAGKIRIICSGDSFVSGYGVGDEFTWCERLKSLNPKLETVNMGGVGYGVDQEYLWYMRDGVKLNHNIHILAVIADDMSRATVDNYIGYSKPYFTIKDGDLMLHNTPVSKFSYDYPLISQNLHLVEKLRVVKLLEEKHIIPNFSEEKPLENQNALMNKFIEKLQEQNVKQGGHFVLVFLPVIDCLTIPSNNCAVPEVRNFLRKKAEKHGVMFIDLTDDFMKLSGDELQKTQNDWGHYSNEGHQFVAEKIYQKLQQTGLLK